MPKEVFVRLLMQPMHGFSEGLLSIHACFLLSLRTIPPAITMAECHLTTKKRRAVKAKEAFFERMC